MHSKTADLFVFHSDLFSHVIFRTWEVSRLSSSIVGSECFRMP